jgi:hypothetical protein
MASGRPQSGLDNVIGAVNVIPVVSGAVSAYSKAGTAQLRFNSLGGAIPCERTPRILKVGAVTGVRKEDQLGVRQALLEDVRVHGRDDVVVAAIHDERRLSDVPEVRVGSAAASVCNCDARL